MTDLLSLVLTLQPLSATGRPPNPPGAESASVSPDDASGRALPTDEAMARPLPTWWGRAAHALLLHIIDQADPALAVSLHDGASGPRPFTTSNLMGRVRNGQLDPQAAYHLRFTALSAPMVEALGRASTTGALSPGQVVELDYAAFRVLEAHTLPPAPPSDSRRLPTDWAGQTSHADLSASLLLSRQAPPRRFTFQFASPTTFKTSERHMPLPIPNLIFGSLLDRWNAFAPVSFPAETRRFAAECLAVGSFNLHTRTAQIKDGAQRHGMIGAASLVCLNYDRYWMSILAVLAAYAQYSGVGVNCSMGLGQARLAPAGSTFLK